MSETKIITVKQLIKQRKAEIRKLKRNHVMGDVSSRIQYLESRIEKGMNWIQNCGVNHGVHSD